MKNVMIQVGEQKKAGSKLPWNLPRSFMGDVVRTKDFTYNTMLSISSNKNKITKLNGSTLDMMHQDLYMEGHAMGTVKGYKVAGIFQSQEQIDELNSQAQANGYYFYQNDAHVGDYMFVDTDGNGYITEADRYAREVIRHCGA